MNENARHVCIEQPCSICGYEDEADAVNASLEIYPCIICGKPLSIGDHSHPGMKWDDVWGLIDDE